MKKLIGIILAVSLLFAVAAPAFAVETKAVGEYQMDVNLEVPEDPGEFGNFIVRIPDGVDLQYGVEDTFLHYEMEFDPERFPVGMNLGLDVISDFFDEWEWTDDQGETHYDCGYLLVNQDNEEAAKIIYRLETDDHVIDGAPYHWEGDYRRDVDGLPNIDNVDNHMEGSIRMHVDYNYENPPAPGYYYSNLTFHVCTGWWFHYGDSDWAYEVADGFIDEKATDWENIGNCAFDPDGNPIRYRIARVYRANEE